MNNLVINVEDLSSALNIDLQMPDKDFVQAVDLVRKEHKVSQEVFCSMVGISRALFTKAKKGDKGVSADNKCKMLKALSDIKELSKLEEDAARMNVCENTSRGLGKYSLEKSISENEAVKEMKEALWKTIQAKQKLKRNAKYFNPSLEPSVDKVTLFIRLTSYTEGLFLRMMDRFGVVSGNTKYTHNGRYKNSKVTEYAHIWQYEGCDCKVHIQYLFHDKKTGEDVRELKVEFNPNKWDIDKNEMLIALMPFLSKAPKLKEFDICKDYIGLKDTNVIMPRELFGKEGTTPLKIFNEDGAKTVYFGDKNKTVNLMIYDKRKEILKKDKKDIGFDCLRAESRYKLKPSENRNGVLTEYRVSLDNISNIKLPIKTYSCQAHMFEEGDINCPISSEDKLLLISLLNGAIDLQYILDTDKEVAKRIRGYLDAIYIENLTITYTDVLMALNSFVFKYTNCIDRFYSIETLEGLNEEWSLNDGQAIEGFEVVGVVPSWEFVDSDDFAVNKPVKTKILLNRDTRR